MSSLVRSAILALFFPLLSTLALADDYAITVDGPLVGSSISRNRVSLGIAVDIDKKWDELGEPDKLAWRQYTELVDPRVTPPFPLPSIRDFLRKLKTPEQYRTTRQLRREDAVLLIVRISPQGTVDQVEIASAGASASTELSQAEAVLAAIYTNALLTTRFSPALMDGKPAASAFPMRIQRLTIMR